MHRIGNLRITELVVHLDGLAQDAQIDLGGVYMRKDDREYVLETCDVYRVDNRVHATLERDDETFPDVPYTLTSEDLFNGATVEAYVSADEPILGVEMIASLGNMTIVIPVQIND